MTELKSTGRGRSAPIVVPTLRVHRVPLPAARVPDVHVPGVGHLMPHLDPRSWRGRALWVGGLGGLAIVGVLEWPVAAAVAAGTWVAERRARAYVADLTGPNTTVAVPEPRASGASGASGARQASAKPATRTRKTKRPA